MVPKSSRIFENAKKTRTEQAGARRIGRDQDADRQRDTPDACGRGARIAGFDAAVTDPRISVCPGKPAEAAAFRWRQDYFRKIRAMCCNIRANFV